MGETRNRQGKTKQIVYKVSAGFQPAEIIFTFLVLLEALQYAQYIFRNNGKTRISRI